MRRVVGLRLSDTVRPGVNKGKTFISPKIMQYYCKYEECGEEFPFIKNAPETNTHTCACVRAPRMCVELLTYLLTYSMEQSPS